MAHKSALDESRQDLSTLIEDAYYVSHDADDISIVESMIAKIDSSASLMSEKLKSLADSDADLAEQDSRLINKETTDIVCSLRTRNSHLQRREIIVTLNKKKVL